MANIYKALLCMVFLSAYTVHARAQENPSLLDTTQMNWIDYNDSIGNIDPGEYYILFREVGTGCVSDTAVFEINLLEQPVAPLVGIITHPTCTEPTGSVVLSGLPEGNWIINPGNIIGSGSTSTIIGLVAGQSYTFTVTASNNCISPPSIEVTIDPQPLTPAAPTAALNQSFCAGSLVEHLVAEYPVGTELRWYSIEGETALAPGTELATGTYYAAAVSTDNCESERVEVEVTVHPQLELTVDAPAQICKNTKASIPATVSGGSGDYTFLWEGVNVDTELLFEEGTNTLSTASLTAENLPSGLYSYRVTVSDNETTCSVSEAYSIEILYDFNIDFLSFEPDVAEGQSGVVYALHAIDGATYEWTVDGGEIVSGQGTSQIVVDWAQAGIFSVSAYMQIGACSQEYSDEVTVHPLPAISLGENPTVCPGAGIAELSYSATTQYPTQYSIEFDEFALQAGFSNIVNDALPVSPFSIPLPDNLPPGTYRGELSVTAYYPTRYSIPLAFEITITPTVILEATVVRSESYPGAQQGRVYIDALSGGTGQLALYLNNDLLEDYAQGSTLRLDPGVDYRLQARDSKGCSSDEFVFTITESSELSFSVEPLQPETCNGTAPVQLIFYDNLDISNYEYSIDGGSWFALPANSIIPNVEGGQHEITLRIGDFYYPSSVSFYVGVLTPIAFGLDKEIIECDLSGTILVQNLEGGNGSYQYLLASDQEKLSGTVSIMGQEYPWVKIGEQYWMAANLAYTDGQDDITAGQEQYAGMYYTHGAAQRIAEQIDGWRLPTLEETAQLSEFAGGDINAGASLKGLSHWNAPNTGASNRFGFNALPAGEILSDGYSGVGSECYFWTENTITSNGETLAVARKLSSISTAFEMNYSERNFARSVRLIKDEGTELQYEGEWENLDPTGRIPNIGTGTYNVVISGGQVCKPLEESITLEIIPPVEFAVADKENVLCYNDESGSITLGEVSGGSGQGYEYRLNNGSWEEYVAGEEIPGLAFRIDGHLLEVRDNRGCMAEPYAFDIDQPDEITIDWAFTAEQSYEGTNNGAIEILNVSGGNSIERIRINAVYHDYYPGMPVNDIPIGTNSLVAIDNEGCESDEYTVFIAQIDSVRFEINDETLPCDEEGQIVLHSITGGIGRDGMEYKLNDDAWILLESDNTISPINEGDHTIMLRDREGNQSALHTFHMVTYTPITFTATDKTIKCDYPGTIEVSNIQGGNGQYFCAISAEPIPDFEQLAWVEANPLSETISSTDANVYVWMKDGNGCISNSTYIELDLKAPIVVDVSNMRSFIYYGGNYEIMSFDAISGGYGGPYAYSLDGGESWDEFNEAIIANYLPFGTYHFVAKDNQGCNSEPIIFTVSQFAELKLTAEVSKHVTCYNGDDGEIFIEKIEGGTEEGYYFRINNGQRIDWNGAYTQSTLEAGEYRIIAYDSFDQESDELVLNITEANPIQIEYLDPETICHGTSNGAITISKIEGDAGNYTHYLNDAIISDLSDSGGTISGLSAGNYVYKVEDENACSREVTIAIEQFANIVLDASQQGSIACHGDQTAGIVVNSISGRENGYSLYVNNEEFEGPFSKMQQLNRQFGAGTYELKVIDENQCSSNIANITINEPDALMAHFSKINDVVCIGEKNGVVQINNLSGGTPNYKLLINNEECIGDVENEMEFSLVAGDYIFHIKDDNNCLYQFPETIKIEQPIPINFTVEVENNISCKGLRDGRLKISNVSGGSIGGNALAYEVSTNKTNWNTYDPNNPFIDNLNAGTYDVWLRANGCVSEPQNETINEGNEISLVNPISYDVSCYDENNGKIKIDAIVGSVQNRVYSYSVNGVNYEYNGGNIELGGLGVGAYSFVVEDDKDCNTTKILTIDEDFKNKFEIDATTNTVCNPNTPSGTVKLKNIETDSDDLYFRLTGQTFYDPINEVLPENNIINNIGQGWHQIQIHDENYCYSKPVDFEIIASEVLEIDYDVENVRCFGEDNGKITINSVEESRTGIKYKYKNGVQGEWNYFNGGVIVDNLEPIRNGKIFVTSEDGCAQGSFNYSIFEPVLLTIDEIKYLPNCNGMPAQSLHQKLEITKVSGGNGNYEFALWTTAKDEPGVTWTYRTDYSEYHEKEVVDTFSVDQDLKLSVIDKKGCEVLIDNLEIRKTEILRFQHESFDAPCVYGTGIDHVWSVTGGSKSGLQYHFVKPETAYNALPASGLIYDVPYGLNHIQLKDDANCVSDIQSFVIESNGGYNIDYDKFIPSPCDGLDPTFTILSVDGRTNKKFKYRVNNGNISEELSLPIEVQGLEFGQLNTVVLVDIESECEFVIDEFNIPRKFEPFSFADTTLEMPQCIDDLAKLSVHKLNGWTDSFNGFNKLQYNINREAEMQGDNLLVAYKWTDYGDSEERTFELLQGNNTIMIKDSVEVEIGKPKQACITEFKFNIDEIEPIKIDYVYGNDICTDEFPHVRIGSVTGGIGNEYFYNLNNSGWNSIVYHNEDDPIEQSKIFLNEGDNTLKIYDENECNMVEYEFNNVHRNNLLEKITNNNLNITQFSCNPADTYATVEIIDYPSANFNQNDQLFIEFIKEEILINEETKEAETVYRPYGDKKMLQTGNHPIVGNEPNEPESTTEDQSIYEFASEGTYYAVVSNQHGCRDSVQFVINMFRKIDYDFEQISTQCNNDKAQINIVNLKGGVGNNGYQYTTDSSDDEKQWVDLVEDNEDNYGIQIYPGVYENFAIRVNGGEVGEYDCLTTARKLDVKKIEPVKILYAYRNIPCNSNVRSLLFGVAGVTGSELSIDRLQFCTDQKPWRPLGDIVDVSHFTGSNFLYVSTKENPGDYIWEIPISNLEIINQIRNGSSQGMINFMPNHLGQGADYTIKINDDNAIPFEMDGHLFKSDNSIISKDNNTFVIESNACTDISINGSFNIKSSPKPDFTLQATYPSRKNGTTTGAFTISEPTGGSGQGYQYTYKDKYEWIELESGSANVSELEIGIYWVKIRDGFACESDIKTVDINYQPTLDLIVNEISCRNEDDAMITANYEFADEDDKPVDGERYSIEWFYKDTEGAWALMDNQKNDYIENLGPGNYRAVFTEYFSDSREKSIEGFANITNPDEFSHLAQITNVACKNGENGLAVLNIQGGTSPYQFNHDGVFLENNRFENLAAGTYNFEINDANECTYLIEGIVVTEPVEALAFSIQKQSPSSFDAADGAISISLTGGWKNYGLELRDDLGLIIAPDEPGSSDNNFTYSFSGLNALTYTVVINDYFDEDKTREACCVTESITIEKPDILQIESISAINPICNGDNNGQITIVAKGGVIDPELSDLYNYTWKYVVDGNAPITLPFTGNTATGLEAGDYLINITDGSGSAISVTYNLPEPRQFNLSAQTTDVSCKGDLGGSIEVSYNQRNGDLLFIDDQVMENMEANNLAAGTYVVRVEDVNGCTETIDVSIFEPDDALEATVSTTDPSAGASNGEVSLSIAGGVSPYQAELIAVDIDENESIISSRSSDGVDVLFDGLPHGQYFVRLSDRYNLATEVLPCVVEIDASLYPSDALAGRIDTITPLGCNQNGLLEAVPLGGNKTEDYYYKWFNETVNKNKKIGSSSQLNISEAGTYRVEITNGNGNRKLTWSESIIVEDPNINIEQVLVQNVACYGDNNGQIELDINGGTEPYNFLWSNGSTSQNLINVGAGDYTITVADALGCTKNQTFSITEPDNPIEINVHQNAITFPSSESASNGSISFNQNRDISGGWGNYTYEWRNSNEQIIGSNLNISGLGVGSYFLTVYSSESENGAVCSQTKEFELMANGLFVFISESGNYICSNTPSLELEANVISKVYKKNDLNYKWYNANDEVISNNEKLSAIPPGTYRVEISTKQGVVLAGKSITLTHPNLFEVLPVATNATHVGATNGSIVVNASGGKQPYTFLWDDGSTSSDRYNLAPGTYSFIATDNKGCELQSELIEIHAEQLAVEINSVRGLLCKEHSNGILRANAHGGVPLSEGQYTYQWQKSIDGVWNNIANAKILNACSVGLYKVLVSDADNNVVTAEFELTAQSNIEISIDVTDADCSGNLGSAMATVTGTSDNYTCNWSNGSVGLLNDNLQGGLYTINVTDEFGCHLSKTVSILQSGELSYDVDITPHQCLSSPDGAIVVSNLQGSGNYNYSWSKVEENGAVSPIEDNNSASLENRYDGDYLLIVEDLGQHSNCSLRQIFTIKHSTIMEEWFNNIPESVNMCFSNSTIIDNVSLPNQPEAEYEWLLNNSIVSYIPLYEISNAGTYTLRVSDQNSCVWEKEIEIEKSLFELHAEFLIPSVSVPGVVVNIVNTSLAINNEDKPDLIEWSYPKNVEVDEKTDENLSLIFSEVGEYVVKLKLVKDNCDITYEKTIIINDEIDQAEVSATYTEPLIVEFKVSPNPVTDTYTVEIEFSRNSPAWLFLHDFVTAHQVWYECLGELNANETWNGNYNTFNVQEGIYVLTLVTPTERQTFKITLRP